MPCVAMTGPAMCGNWKTRLSGLSLLKRATSYMLSYRSSVLRPEQPQLRLAAEHQLRGPVTCCRMALGWKHTLRRSKNHYFKMRLNTRVECKFAPQTCLVCRIVRSGT